MLAEIAVRVSKLMLMHVEYQPAIKQIQGELKAGRAKHIAICLKLIKDFSKKKIIKVVYCELRFM